jgi:hypothetical protein
LGRIGPVRLGSRLIGIGSGPPGFGRLDRLEPRPPGLDRLSPGPIGMGRIGVGFRSGWADQLGADRAGWGRDGPRRTGRGWGKVGSCRTVLGRV